MIGAETTRVESALEALKGHYPREIELSLDRIDGLLERMGCPHKALPPTIHVAGTNGKGSTCAFMRAIAEAAGLRVHVFTSPHLVRFNERIRLAGQLISDAQLADALERVKTALNGEQITHFEATTAAAFLAFAETPADLLILEVGLGGRYDATNSVGETALAVITPVDYDHKQFLGDDLAGIAGEKAGIIRSNTPVLSAIQTPIVAGVIEDEAESQHAERYVLTHDEINESPQPLIMKGAHQHANAALARKALQLWGHPAITDTACVSGIAQARWPARMQLLADGPLTREAGGIDIWLDGGHNPHAATAVAKLLSDMGGQTALVTAMMASKDSRGFFSAFGELAPHVFTAPNASGHAGADPDDLAVAAKDVGLKASAHTSFGAAYAEAIATRPDRILICGSLYLAGDVLTSNGETPD